MTDAATIDRKIKRLRSLMADIDNVYFNIKSERHSYYQALLSLGDRRVAPAIEAAERNGQNWRAAVAESGVDADFFLFRDRSRDADAALGHHRRRHEGVVLQVGVRQGPPRRMDAAAEAGAGERAAPPGHPVVETGRAEHRSLQPDQPDAHYDRDRRALLVLLKRFEDQLAQLVLRRDVDDRAQQREAAPLAVDAVLARGKRDVSCRRRRRGVPRCAKPISLSPSSGPS